MSKVICICGSTRFRSEIAEANRRLTLQGNIVIAPGVFMHDGDAITDADKAALDALHLEKIDLADRVHVVNPGQYVGESTAKEIMYALAAGKRVTFSEVPRHTVAVTSESPDSESKARFECQGSRNSGCHIYPDCECEQWSEGHEKEHPYTQHASCWMADWFENSNAWYNGDDNNDSVDGGLPHGMIRRGEIDWEFEDGLMWSFAEVAS
ncbi:UNVERIFIED_ORG: hypothetical protein ABID57_001295 [Arthrobacter sp. UYEF1]